MKRIARAAVVALGFLLCSTGGATAQFSAVRPQAPGPGADLAAPEPAPPGTLVELNGIARATTNVPVRFAALRLRDARTGRMVGVTTSDQNGMFTFGSVRPGFYVVEITDNAGRVLATSPLISANAGDVVSTLVKVPARFLVGGMISGQSVSGGLAGTAGATAGSIAAVTSAALSAGVLALSAAGRPASPEQ